MLEKEKERTCKKQETLLMQGGERADERREHE